MTLTSEKTATKRHAWLVGATTAAMAVALIGVGPIAANAATPPNGVLGVTVAAQSAGTTLTAPTLTAGGSNDDAAGNTATVAFGNVTYTVSVTTTERGATADVTSDFTFGRTGTDNTELTITATDATPAQTTPGDYKLVLTPTVSGDVLSSDADVLTVPFTVVADTTVGATSGNIQDANGDEVSSATPDALIAPVVQLKTGTITNNFTSPKTSTNAVVTGGDLTANVTVSASSSSVYLPVSSASYRLAVTPGAAALPVLATGTTPFGATDVANSGGPATQPALSSVQNLTVSASQTAPLTINPIAVGVWSVPATSPFNDVTTSTQFYSDMAWLSDAGISTGYADGGFHYAATIKRNAMAAFLYRLAGSPAVSQQTIDLVNNKFSDLSAGAQFDKEIAWLYQQGITTGYTRTTFGPAQTVTRGAMAAFLYRFVNNNTATGDLDANGVDEGSSASVSPQVVEVTTAGGANYAPDTFSDVKAGTQFAGDIAWLASDGVNTVGDGGTAANNPATRISGGYADGTFRPSADIKRNAMAAFLSRLAAGE